MKESKLFKRLVVTLFCLCINAYADTKSEKVAELVEAQGLFDQWAAQIEHSQEFSRAQEQTIVDQTLSRLNPNEEFRQRFSSAIREFKETTAAPWTAEYMVEIYSSFYGPHFSEAEVDELIAFYSSNLGQKNVRSTRMATAEFLELLKLKNRFLDRPRVDHVRKFTDQMHLIARECNCAK